MAGKTIRQFLDGLGYIVHTPASVFGRRRLQQRVYDEQWLPIVGANGWAVFCRDQHILDRDVELKAYLDARVHMFVLPGNSTRQQIVDLLSINLSEICTLAVARRPNVYWLMSKGVVQYERRRAETIGRRDRRQRQLPTSPK